MKVRHKNSLQQIDLSEPSYGKYNHDGCHYGYLVYSNNKVLFFYEDIVGGGIEFIDVTEEYDLK